LLDALDVSHKLIPLSLVVSSDNARPIAQFISRNQAVIRVIGLQHCHLLPLNQEQKNLIANALVHSAAHATLEKWVIDATTAQTILFPTASLKHLTLKNCSFEEAAVTAFVTALESNRNLRALQLKSCTLNADNVKAICDALKTNTTLYAL